ncbi:MAG: thiamine-phosphate kinase [Candidatus Omnitrophica bacterium]|nr:thiamine-phosphate kinase [Candidatus Omnitrophota bacterium]
MKELKIAEEIRKTAGNPGKGVHVGIGDDCAVLTYDRRKYLLWAADMLIEDVHFNVKSAGYERIGRKAVAVNISDVAAMGGVPKYITVSIGIPPARRVASIVKTVYKGINKVCREYGVKIVGGDTNRSEKLVIDVSIIGFVTKKQLVTRAGAKEGDLVLITGPVRDGKKAHLDFDPRVKESGSLVRDYRIHSMIDVSDGIAPDLGRICDRSGVGAVVSADSVPLSRGLSLKDALYYGESFELLFTMSTSGAKRLLKNNAFRREGCKYFVIGEVTQKKDGLRLMDEKGGETALKMRGFEHL